MLLGYEDYEYWMNCTARGARGRMIKEPLVRYRKHGHSRITDALQRDAVLKSYIYNKFTDCIADARKVDALNNIQYKQYKKQDALFEMRQRYQAVDARPSAMVLVDTFNDSPGNRACFEEIIQAADGRMPLVFIALGDLDVRENLIGFLEERGVRDQFTLSVLHPAIYRSETLRYLCQTRRIAHVYDLTEQEDAAIYREAINSSIPWHKGYEAAKEILAALPTSPTQESERDITITCIFIPSTGTDTNALIPLWTALDKLEIPLGCRWVQVGRASCRERV